MTDATLENSSETPKGLTFEVILEYLSKFEALNSLDGKNTISSRYAESIKLLSQFIESFEDFNEEIDMIVDTYINSGELSSRDKNIVGRILALYAVALACNADANLIEFIENYALEMDLLFGGRSTEHEYIAIIEEHVRSIRELAEYADKDGAVEKSNIMRKRAQTLENLAMNREL